MKTFFIHRTRKNYRSNLVFVSVLLIVLFSLSIKNTFGQSIQIQNTQSRTSSDFFQDCGTWAWAQSFTVGSSDITVTSIDVDLQYNGSSGNVRYYIYSNNDNGTPSTMSDDYPGSVVTNGTSNTTAINTSGSWYWGNCTFGTSPVVLAGKKYWVIAVTSGSTFYGVNVGLSSGSTSPWNNEYSSYDSWGSCTTSHWNTYSSYDIRFRLYGTIASCTSPSTQASAFGGNTPTTSSMNIAFTRGNGTGGVMVVAKAGSAPTDPTPGTTYVANTAFGSGDACGGGYVVYNGTASGTGAATGNIAITALAPSTVYYFNVYEYNSSGTCYNLTELAGTYTTSACGTSIMTQNFDGGGLPASWTRAGATDATCNNGQNSWYNTSEVLPSGKAGNTWCAAPCLSGRGGAGRCMFFNSYSQNGLGGNSLVMAPYDLSGYTYATLNFYIFNGSGTDILKVYAKNGAGAYSQVGAASYGVYASWTLISIDISAWAGTGMTAIYIKFEGNGDCGADNIALDDISIVGCPSIPPGNSYGVYAPGAISGVADCEIYATAVGTGSACKVCQPADAGYSNVLVSGATYSVIVAGNAAKPNMNCTAIDMNMTYGVGTPTWTFSGGTPAGPTTGSPKAVQYASAGRYNVVMNGKTYTGFNNVSIVSPSKGTITPTQTNGCPGTYHLASSLGNTSGYSYEWSETHTGGTDVTINFNPKYSYSTDVTYTNNSLSNQTVTLTYSVSSSCCGYLGTVAATFTLNSAPSTPTVTATSSNTVCPGGTNTLTANANPAGCTYQWYSDSAGTSFLGSGATLMVSPPAAGTYTYYSQAISPLGCVSIPAVAVTVTATATAPPTVSNVPSCASGVISTVNYGAYSGGASYNWYLSDCSNLDGTGYTYACSTCTAVGTYTYYVSVTEAGGCNPSACTTFSVTINATPSSETWVGTTSNWFVGSNWSSGCVPVCGTDVSIGATAHNPDINGTDVATCGSISLASGAAITFSDNKAELDVCGNFTQSGAITTNGKGKVSFVGTSEQTFTKTSTGSGSFHNVEINNTGTPPLLTIVDGGAYGSANQNLDVDSNLIFINGIVVTQGGRKITVNNTGTSAIVGHGVSGYVNGMLTRKVTNGTSYDFPVGGNPVTATAPNYPYELMNLNISTITAQYLTVFFDNPATTNSDGSGLPIAEQSANYSTPLVDLGGTNSTTGAGRGAVWSMLTGNALADIYNSAASTTASYSMTIYGRNFATGTFPAGNYYSIVKRDPFCPGGWSIGSSVFAGGMSASNVITASRNSFSGFSQAGVVKHATILPIELVVFDATCVNHSTLLSWITATEVNNNYFTLERSCDENFFQYQTIATLPGAGSSSSLKQYTYADTEAPGNCYYRLSQTDYNGTITQFAPISINCKENADFNFIGVLPNPAESEINVLFSDAQNENVVVVVTDMLGQPIVTKNVLSDPGLNKIAIDLTNYSAGFYFVKLNNDNKTFIKKIVKNK